VKFGKLGLRVEVKFAKLYKFGKLGGCKEVRHTWVSGWSEVCQTL